MMDDMPAGRGPLPARRPGLSGVPRYSEAALALALADFRRLFSLGFSK